MNPIRAKYQRRNIITSNQPQESEKPKETRRATTTIIETKIERPYSRKVVEQRVEMNSESSNNNFGRMPKTMGRYSAIVTNKRDNVVTISTSNREKSLDKYKRENKEKENDNKYTPNATKNSTRPNYRWSVQVPEQKVEKEPVKWKRFSRVKEEEKPKQDDISNRPIITSKTVKEEKTEKTPNAYTSTRYTKTTVVETKRNSRNNPDEKVVKTEVHVVTKSETPKEKEIENKKENNVEPKSNYRSRRNQYRANKTDEDLPQKKEEKEKEDIKIESRKRKTLQTAFNPYSRKLKDMKFEKNPEDKNDNEKNDKADNNDDNSNNNKRGYNYYKKKNNDNNKTNIDNDNDKNNNEDINENKNADNNNYKHNTYKNENPDNSDNKYKSYNNANSNRTDSKYRAAKTEPSDDTENNFKYKSYSKITKKDGNKKVVKEETIEENINDSERKNRLKNSLNEIERVCADRTLKNDLIELFNKVLENNMEFKDEIFFKNLNDTESKVGNMDKVDKERISHTYKEIETSEILSNLENANDLMNKYTQRAKTVVEEY